MRANDVIYMKEVNGAASKTSLGVNGADTAGAWLEF